MSYSSAWKDLVLDSKHFIQTSNTTWTCNVCTISKGGPPKRMSIQYALRHERSNEHRTNVSRAESWDQPVDLSGWENTGEAPLTCEDVNSRERQYFVDHVRDIVPFWIKGVEAAERGEILKLEEFLDSMRFQSDDSGWGLPADDPWAVDAGWVGNGWGDGGGWARSSVSSIHARRTDSAHKPPYAADGSSHPSAPSIHYDDSFSFVEDFARQRAVDTEQKKRMHTFFSMSTQDKVQKIEEIIRCLRNA